MPFIAQPLWLLLPLVALALLFLQPVRGRLPGGWTRLVNEGLQRYLARGVRMPTRDWRRPVLILLWCLVAVMLAKISFGVSKSPDLANLYARVLVLDLGVASDRQQLVAARQIIQQFPEVPTGIVAVTGQAFDVVPVTTDQRHLDRYLEVLSSAMMPASGRRPERGLQRAALLLGRGKILAGQIVMLSAGLPPDGSDSVAKLAGRYGLWIVAASDNANAWRAYGQSIGVDRASINTGIGDAVTFTEIAADLQSRRAAAAANAASVRERRELTPWLIGVCLPLWLLLFFRRGVAL